MPTLAQLHTPLLGELLAHPVRPVGPDALAAAMAIRDFSAEVARHLTDFAEAMAPLDLDQQQELHGATFDLTPACTPFLSVHIFGDESFKRAELMAGLAGAYAQHEYSTRGEVPDHLGVVLGFAPMFAAEEWDELGHYCLPVALAKMRVLLAASSNPYAQLINAITELMTIDFPRLPKEKPCSTSFFSEPSHTSPSSFSLPGACGGCGQTPSATAPCRPSF